MYDVPRTHSQFATLQLAGLAAMKASKRGCVPPVAWSSPVITSTAFFPRGIPEFRQRFLRLVHELDQIDQQALLLVGLGNLDLGEIYPVGLRIEGRIAEEQVVRPDGVIPSRSWPAQAGLPWRV